MPSTRVFSWLGMALVVTFLMLWILTENIRREKGRQPQAHQDDLDLATSDLIKSLLSFSVWLVCPQLQGVHLLSSLPILACSPAAQELCNIYFHEHGHDPTVCPNWRGQHPRRGINLTPGNMRSTLSILIVGFVCALHAYTDLRTREFIDPFSLPLAFPMSVLGILTIFRVIPWRNFPSSFWHAAILQFAGLFIAKDAFAGSALPPCSLLITSALCDSIWVSLVDVVYGLHHSSSVHLINTLVFAESCLLHYLLFLLHLSSSISHPRLNHFIHALQPLPLIEAAKSVVTIFIIRQYGAIIQGTLTVLASTFVIMIDAWMFTKTPCSVFIGCLVAIMGSGIFLLCGQCTDEQQHGLAVSSRRCIATVTIALVTLGHIVVSISQSSRGTPLELSSVWKKMSGLPGHRSDCRVPESSTLIHAQTIANYTHFSNILLIVFFSHARYDANLDFHKEVYADYFPNIVYVGPATREDKGFAHSYDVLVDSFQSEEDLSDPLFYKMAGRMAHHMLYTALREYGCYDGYLWVPFDALINVPRLQQFNQSLFWYHSPWGQPVPNLAFGDLVETELNVSRHAPPAMISPDTSINLTETWRGWGPDWWWGDPHVGVSVCMSAFHKVPTDMRDHLARLSNGQTRLIGGSADTLYIPGRHRTVLMDVLALFLETDCFLEIATPTTVHLVVPPGEPIQFVDHWWIYQPPFNASFVRQRWAQGYEVDTFHTFHWGERGEDGVWRGNHRHVADVRHLLRESANRQGLSDMFPVNLGDDDGMTHV